MITGVNLNALCVENFQILSHIEARRITAPTAVLRWTEALTMAEYIRREDAIKCIEGQCVDGKMWGKDESEGTLIDAYSAIDDLMEIPPADVAQVRHGRWIVKVYVCGETEYRCSECKETEWRTSASRLKYCPNCGAKMDG